VNVRRFDLRSEEVPEADYVILCSSFYHFRDRESEILAKLRRAARKAVILSEPVDNLSSGGRHPFGALLRPFTKPGPGSYRYRYDLESFRAFAQREGASEVAHESDWRNAVAVFEGMR
jgi:hypothetical protein